MIIWIEVELHSNNYSADYIANKEWLNFKTFTYLKDMKIWVKLSREYYNSTIEYNFTPFENTLENFNVVKEFLEWQINRYDLKLNNHWWPNYVWTHMHIFDENKINMRLQPLLEWVAWFISENISNIERQSIYRLLFAHQLWGNYSWKNNHIWKEFLNRNWKSPEIYDNTRNKWKYNPIIYSKMNEESGKPKSLEIRIIPNDFIFNLKIYELLSLIEHKSLSSKKKDIMEFYSVLYNKLYWVKPIITDINNTNNTSNDEITIEQVLMNDGLTISNITSNKVTSTRWININEHMNINISNQYIFNILRFYYASSNYECIIEVEHLDNSNHKDFIEKLHQYNWSYNECKFELIEKLISHFNNPS